MTADGSTLPPNSGACGTGWAAASLSLVVVAELERTARSLGETTALPLGHKKSAVFTPEDVI